jgi:O-antigen ligase
VWEFAAEKALARPLLGWGLEASRAVPGGQERPPVGYAYMPLHPHNAALQIWLELGFPGAALAALVMALLGTAAASAPRANLCAAATTGTLVAFAMVAFTAYGAWQSWWIAVAWLTAAALVALRMDDGTARTGGRSPHDC